MNVQLGNVLYSLLMSVVKQTPQQKLECGDTKVSELPMYGTMLYLGELVLTNDKELSNKNKKLLSNLLSVVSEYSDPYPPMYLTPKELVQKLPELSLGQVVSEVKWLSGL